MLIFSRGFANIFEALVPVAAVAACTSYSCIYIYRFLIHDASAALSRIPSALGISIIADGAFGPPFTFDYKFRVTDRLPFKLYTVYLAVRLATKLRNWEVGRFQFQPSVCAIGLLHQGL